MSDKQRMSDKQKVGYKNPPKHTQFKPGQSGNKKGRPKGSKNMVTTLDKILNEKVSLREGNRVRRVTKAEAMTLTTVNKAMNGNQKAVSTVILMAKLAGYFEVTPEKEVRSGVLVVPAPMTVDEWAKAAFEQQREARKPKKR